MSFQWKDPYDSESAGTGTAWVDPYDAELAERAETDGLSGALYSGVERTLGALRSTWDAYTGDAAGVEQEAVDAQGIAQTPEQRAFSEEVRRRSAGNGDESVWQGIKNVAGAVAEEPLGALHEVAAQLPNSAVTLGGMYAGAKLGAAAGSFAGPAGTVIGTFAGGLIGMFAGNTAVETGYIAQDKAQDGAVTDEELSAARGEGATKGGVITAVDAATLGLNRWIGGGAGRAVEQAITKTLTDRGVDVANEAAVKAALSSRDVARAATEAGAQAFQEATTAGKQVARGTAKFTLETAGEGVGEYAGSAAAGQDASFTEAALESLLSVPQSVTEMRVAKKLEEPGRLTGLVNRAANMPAVPGTPPTQPLSDLPITERAAAQKAAADQAQAEAERLTTSLGAAPIKPIPNQVFDIPPTGMRRPGVIDYTPPELSTSPGAAPERADAAESGIPFTSSAPSPFTTETDEEAERRVRSGQSAGALPQMGADPMLVMRDGTTARASEIDAEIARLESSGQAEDAANLRARIAGYPGGQSSPTTPEAVEAPVQIIQKNGKPYASLKAAQLALRARKDVDLTDYNPVEVEGGFALVRGAESIAQPAPAPRLTREQIKQRDRNVDGKTDDLLAAIAKTGGISRAEAEAQGIDPAEFKRRGHKIKLVFTQNGDSFDGMAERLAQHGYPVTDEQGNYSPNVLLERLSEALAGNRVVSAAGLEADLERQAQAREAAPYDDTPPDALGGEDFLDELAMVGDDFQADADTADLADAIARAQEIIGEDAVEAILERAAVQAEDAGYADLAITLLETATHEAKPTEAGAGRAGDGGGSQAQAEDAQETRVTAEERRALTADRRQKKRPFPKSQERRQSDRRQDTETRKRVDEMTPEEMRHALLTDPLTGLGNRRAYDESEKMPFQVAIDLDGLKFVNDTYGHDAGDQFIAEFGAAVQAITGDGYHLSGDEFMVQAINESAAIRIMREIEAAAADIEIAVTITKTGEEATVNGVHFSYGIGQDKAAADKRLYEHKDERKRAGIRKDREPDDGGPVEAPPAAQVQGSAQEEEVAQSPADAGLSDSVEGEKSTITPSVKTEEQPAQIKNQSNTQDSETSTESAPTDLFGQAPVKEQALADAKREKDTKRNGRRDVPMDAPPGTLFNQGQQDIEDTQPEPAPKDEESADADTSASDAWDAMREGDRAAIASAIGWVTSKGVLDRTGRKIVNSSWDQLSAAAKNLIAQRISGQISETAKSAPVSSKSPLDDLDAIAKKLNRDPRAFADLSDIAGPVTALVSTIRKGVNPKAAIKAVKANVDLLTADYSAERDAILKAVAEIEGNARSYSNEAAPQVELQKDVGENLWYNRRNLTGTGIRWEDVKDLNDTLKTKEVTKQKVWPKPNYEQLVKDGLNPFFARIIKAVYDGISTTPDVPRVATDADMQRYIDVVKRLKEGVFAWAKDTQSQREFLGMAMGHFSNLMSQEQSGPIALSALITDNTAARKMHKVLLDRFWPSEAGKPSYASFARDTEAGQDVRIIGGNKPLKAFQIDARDIKKFMGEIADGWPAKQEAWQKTYRVLPKKEAISITEGFTYKDGERQARFMVRVGGRYLESFDTREQAQAAVDASPEWYLVHRKGSAVGQFDTQAEAIEAGRQKADRKKAGGGDIRGMNIGEAERTGPEYRKPGENVTSERLMQTFGFRGVNFGREGWINAAERQAYLNHAYDGLMDLADILDVPPLALSLNGALGIAFGAQGRGGQNAAHFVPGVNEINLTKTMGAGTLAHEWGHALDHYFAVMAGMAKERDPFLSNANFRRDLGDVRPEIAAAFKAISEAMNSRPETPDEYRARIENIGKVSRERLDKWIGYTRKQLLEGNASESLLTKFDSLAERMRKGDLGEGYTKVGNKQFPQVIAEVRTLFKEATGRLWSLENIQGLDSAASSVRYDLLRDTASERHIPVSTSYRKASISKDKSKGGKAYWSTPWEMFARAFETWVASRLADKAQTNTFLSDAHLRAEATDHEGGFSMPYPREDERARINAAFDVLVDAIETKETDAGVAMYSRKAGSYETAVDGVLDEEIDQQEAVEVGGTPDVLLAVNAPDLPLYMTGSVIDKVHYDHGLTRNQIKRIPDLIADPVAIFESDTQPGTFVVVTDEMVGGKPLVVAVHPNKRLGRATVNFIPSAHPRQHPQKMVQWVKDGLLRYINKQKSPGWQTTVGVRFPEVGPAARGSSAKIVTERDVVNKGGDSALSRKTIQRVAKSSVSDLESVLRKPLSSISKLFPVNIVQSVADLPGNHPADVRGMFANGAVWLVADNLPANEAAAALAHEAVGHLGLETLLGPQMFNDLVKMVQQQKRMGSKRILAIVADLEKNYTDADGKYTLDARQEAREILAHLAEGKAELLTGSALQKLYQRIKAKIRLWLASKGFGNFDNALINDLIVRAARMVQGEESSAGTMREALAYQRRRDSGTTPSMTTNQGSGDNLTDTQPLEPESEAPHVASARQIFAAMQEDPLAHYGLRVVDYDGQIEIGDILPNSKEWVDGEETEFELDGTSAANIARNDIKSVLQAIRDLGAHGVRGENGFYFGDRVLLIKGDVVGYGEDIGEVILSRAQVVGEWRKPSMGNSEVQPNPNPSQRSQGAGDVPAYKRKAADTASQYADLNRRIREEHITAWDKAKTWLKRQLTPGGLLPEQVFKEKIKRDSEFEVIEFDVAHLVGQLERAVQADYGMKARALDEKVQRLLSDVMAGNVDQKVPEKTKTVLLGMRQYIDRLSAQYAAILTRKANEAMAESERLREEQRALSEQRNAIEDTDENADEREELLAQIRSLVARANAKQAEAMSTADTLQTIVNNMGEYVNRSYRAFDDKDWARKVPDKVLDDAREYLIGRYTEDGTMEEADAARRAEVVMNEILKHGTAYESMEGFIKESKLGAKDLSILKRRKEIAPQIRALLGEYTDPRITFAKSATKMGRLIWNQTFLDRVLEIGMGQFLWTDATKPPEATAQIASDSSDAYDPLNGLWTTPEVNQAFKDALGREQMADWYRTIVQINGMVKYGKTVLAPTTMLRNWYSAFFFTVANGHFDIRHIAKSYSAWREYLFHKGADEKLAYLRRLKQLGVVYDTPYAGEMMRLLEDSRIADKLVMGRGRFDFKEGLDTLTKLYQFGDDFFKIIGFENEKRLWMKQGLSEAAAEEKAAERIRNTYPTYSMVGRGIQSLRRFPLAGTFVSFPAEIIRTTGNMLRYLAADMKDPKTRPLAMRRAAGLMIASSFAYALQALTMAMMGVDDDDDEAVRRMAAPWQRNSNLLYTGRDKDGNIRFMDLSFLDPYNYWKRPIMAIMRDQPYEDMLGDIAKETLTPFFGTDIAAGAIFEVMANKKESGAPVYSEYDEIGNQAAAIANHLRKAVQPGIASNLERTWKALEGEVSPSGRKYDKFDELAAWAGFRMSTLDPKMALRFRAFEFKDAKAAADKKLRDVILKERDADSEDLRDASALTMRLRQNAYSEMILLVDAAKKSGMGNKEIMDVLKSSGVSGDDRLSILNGKVPKYRPSERTVKEQIAKAKAAFGTEAAEQVRRRYREVRSY